MTKAKSKPKPKAAAHPAVEAPNKGPMSIEDIVQLAARVEFMWRQAMGDCLFYIKNYVMIEDKDAADPVRHFDIWPKQEEALDIFLRHRLSIVLKARQLGLSWLALAYASWRLVFRPGYTVIALSKREDEANELARRMKFILKHLPRWMIQEKKYASKDFAGPTWEGTTSQITIYHPDSEPATFKSFTSSEDSARSFTANLVILDEWAFQQFASKIWSAAYPTINRPGGGQVIGISTAKMGTFFEEVWESASKGSNDFKPIFLPWWSDPRRDQKWYENTKKNLPHSYLQEYPCVAKGTLVGTDCGILPIEQVEAGMATSKGPIKARLNKGVRDVVEITTAARRKLVVTPEHKIATPHGYVEAQSLLAGDKICLQVPNVAQKPPLVTWKTSPICESRIKVTPELGRFLGYFMGDGSFGISKNRSNTLDFACDIRDQDVIKDITGLCQTISGLPVSQRITGSKGGCCNLRSYGGEWFNILFHLGALRKQGENGSWARSVCVPACIKQSPKEVIAEFLSGLFEADGCVYAYATNIQLFSKYEQFLRDVQLLLLTFGIHSKIKIRDKRHPDGHTYTGRVLLIPKADSQKFVEQIGFLSERKREKCQGEIAAQRKLRGVADFTDTVVSVTPCGQDEVYDLIIEGNEHAFDANGILVHNCTPQEAFSVGEMTAFPEFDIDVHVCDPFPIPSHWRRWMGVDNGYSDPFWWGWFAVSENGDIYLYREFTRGPGDPKLTYSEQAAKVAELCTYTRFDDGIETNFREPLDYIVCGRDAWNSHHRDVTGKNLIDYYLEGGLTHASFIPAITDRRLRKVTMHEYLQPEFDANTKQYRARFTIFNTCTSIIDTLPRLPRDKKDPEKVADCSIDHCLTGDTLVDTVGGQVAIRDLVGREGAVLCYDETKGEATESRFYDVRQTASAAPVFEVILDDGRSFKATGYHPVLTRGGWKTINELGKGEEIIDICINSH